MMKQIDHINRIREELEAVTECAYSLKKSWNPEGLAHVSEHLNNIKFYASYAALDSSNSKKLQNILRPLYHLADPIEMQLKRDRSISLLATQIMSIAGRREKGLLRRMEKKLKMQSRQAKKEILKALRDKLSKMDLQVMDRKLEKVAGGRSPDLDRERGILRKKYLKALLPVQIFNAEGQQSRSPAAFEALQFAINEILHIVDNYLGNEESARENLQILLQSLKQLSVLDSLKEFILKQLDREIAEIKAFIDDNMQAERQQWGELMGQNTQNLSINDHIHALNTIQTLRDNTCSNFLLIWEELEYHKTWFIIFNQSFN